MAAGGSGPLGRTAARLTSPLLQGASTRIADHRPWPMPRARWVMAQTCRDVLFAHWAVDPAALDHLVPRELAIETFGGRAWVGIVAFRVQGLRARLMLPAPRLSAFPEIDVRTYVSYGGMPGVAMLSVDAGGAPAVPAPGRLYGIPHFSAQASIAPADGGWTVCRSDREDRGAEAPPASLHVRYRAGGPVAVAPEGTLTHWLTERYCLYTVTGGTVRRGELHHPPWPLAPAEAELTLNTMTAPLGLELAGEPDVQCAARQDLVLWPLQRVD